MRDYKMTYQLHVDWDPDDDGHDSAADAAHDFARDELHHEQYKHLTFANTDSSSPGGPVIVVCSTSRDAMIEFIKAYAVEDLDVMLDLAFDVIAVDPFGNLLNPAPY